MPTRNTREHLEGGPQGSDAFVEFRAWTLDETMSYTRLGETIKDVDEVNRIARERVAETLFAWNWVDGNGDPLPPPHRNPEVIGSLTGREMRWLIQAFQGQTPEQLEEQKKGKK